MTAIQEQHEQDMTSLNKKVEEALSSKPSAFDSMTSMFKTQIGDLQKKVDEQETTLSGGMQELRSSQANELQEL